MVVSGYDDELRARVIDRWIELETASRPAAALPNFADPVAAARAWADAHEARQIAERTKAEIGSRREATAMNTASQAVKRANQLEVALDRSREFAAVKRMEAAYRGRTFDWRTLKRVSTAMDLPIKKTFDQNYGEVNVYHAAAWREAYGLEIPQPETH